ncbi:MAG TPA: hypothetical protein VLH77_00155 [Gammaproteobacteria bacterium]|nr:hypothetical protein [Gammaproteobacteria bacterium]
MNKNIFTLFLLSWLGFHSLAEARLPPIKPGVPGKKAGDIIAPMLDEQIAAWCDFSKQIIVTRTNILCVYVGDKTASTFSQANLNSSTKWAKAKAVPKDLTATPYEMNEYGGT